MGVESTVEPTRLTYKSRLQALGLLLAVCGYVAHYLWYTVGERNWFIEDAGISFAFARNWIAGDGLVATVGGERVEGYSNPLWTFLVALFYAVGIEGWISAKVMGGVFGVLTLWTVWRLGSKALGETTTAAWTALLGPALLAVSPQFVIWNTSGLENSLFCFLLALGSLRLVVEAEDESHRPWSAIAFVLLSWTRPEGAMYAAVGWVVTLYGALQTRSVRRLVAWSVLYVVPVALFQAWRWSYFAWPLPNTYYAKLGIGDRFQPWNWTGRGWRYIKNYLNDHAVVYALPLLVPSLAGFRPGRRIALAALTVVLVWLVVWDGDLAATYLAFKTQVADLVPALESALPRRIDLGSPGRWVKANWNQVRVLTILAVSIGLGLVTLGEKKGTARGVVWAMCASALFYPLYVGGDWMKAFRWLNPVTVMLFPLFGIGVGRLLDEGGWLAFRIPLPARVPFAGPRPLAFLAIVGAVLLGRVGFDKSKEFWTKPETTVRNIQKRVQYMSEVQRALEIDHVTLLDVDMGAHMLYTDWAIVDIAGLVDVPMAHHPRYDEAFITEYLFEERKPEFAHLHGGWARTSKIDRYDQFEDGYIEIPGYPAGGRALHIGNHIRKDLLVSAGRSDAPRLRFEGGIDLVSWEIPSPVVADGGQVYVHTTWSADRETDFRILLFLDGKERAVTMFPPGHGYYGVKEWKPEETITGHLRIQVPKGMAEGSYEVGIVLIDGVTGAVIPALGAAEVQEPPRFLSGEVMLGATVTIGGLDLARKEAEADRTRALDLASFDCEAAWRAWKEATWHVTRNVAWQDEERPAVERAMARCWLERARVAETDEDRRDAFVQARQFDPRNDDVLAAGAPLAQTLHDRGDAFRSQGDVEQAYRAYADAVAIDPRRSWSRRRAEEMRDLRLGIPPIGMPEAPKPSTAAAAAKDAKEEPEERPEGEPSPE